MMGPLTTPRRWAFESPLLAGNCDAQIARSFRRLPVLDGRGHQLHQEILRRPYARRGSAHAERQPNGKISGGEAEGRSR